MFRRRRIGGSAAIEFVVIAPFVLILAVLVWNIRSFILVRTEIARESFAVAEAIADHPDGATSPIENALQAFRVRLEEDGTAGSLAAAVVVRGTTRHDGSACPAGGWCPPRVTVLWPTTPTAGTWPAGGTCAGASDLPAVNAHFGQNDAVLPGEAADPDGAGPLTPPSEDAWLSRNMDDDEWWVVIDICFNPGEDIRLDLSGLPWVGAFVLNVPELRRRAAWGSVHSLNDCDWCP